jgi:signal transduction histidine kinase
MPIGPEGGRRGDGGRTIRSERPDADPDLPAAGGVAASLPGPWTPAGDQRAGAAPRHRELIPLDHEGTCPDLHEDVVQRLMRVRLNLRGVEGVLGSGPLAACLRDSIEDLDTVIEEFRGAVVEVDQDASARAPGLACRLLDVLVEASPALGFFPRLCFSGVDVLLPEAIEADLLAVLHAALADVARHGRAADAHVVVTVSADQLTALVTDDGEGTDLAARRTGLDNLQRRAHDHAGAFSVEPEQPPGTRLTWTVALG